MAVQIAAVALVGVVRRLDRRGQRVFASDRLRVGRLEVRGSHFLSEGEVRELIGPAVGESILALDIEALKARLRASPWVADATVTRALPDTVRVEIHERVPLALAELDRLYLMDADGALIDIYGPRTAAFDLPIVRGLSDVERGLAPRARAARGRAARRPRASSAARSPRCWSSPRATCAWCCAARARCCCSATPPYRTQFVTFLEPAPRARGARPGAEYFDLRFRDRIFAKQPKVPVTPSEPGAAPSHPAAEQAARRDTPASRSPRSHGLPRRRVTRPRGVWGWTQHPTERGRQLLAKKKDRYIVGPGRRAPTRSARSSRRSRTRAAST